MAYKTGRQRTLSAEVDITTSYRDFVVDNTGTGYLTHTRGTRFSANIGSPSISDDYRTDMFFNKYLDIHVTNGISSDTCEIFMWASAQIPFTDKTASPTIHAEFSIDVEEWVSIETPTENSVVDNTPFPAFWSGAISSWGPPAIRMIFYELPRVGGTVTASVNGTTVSDTISSIGDLEFTYGINAYLKQSISAGCVAGTDADAVPGLPGESGTATLIGKFQTVDYSIPLSSSSSNFTGNASVTMGGGITCSCNILSGHGVVNVPGSHASGATQYAEASGFSGLPIGYKVKTKSYLLDGSSYPNSLWWRVDEKASLPYQEYYTSGLGIGFQQEIYNGSADANYTVNTINKNDRKIVRVGLMRQSEDNESYKDWRVMGTTYPRGVLTLSQGQDHKIANAKSLTMTNNWFSLLSEKLEGYRYLKLKDVTLIASAARDITLTIGSKTFKVGTIPTGIIPQDYIVDLCYPILSNTFEIDTRNDRWPVKDTATAPAPFDEPEYTTENNGGMFGILEYVDMIYINGLQSGDGMNVGEVDLTYINEPVIGSLMPFEKEQVAWHGYNAGDQIDTTMCTTDFHIITDGKMYGRWTGRFHILPVSGVGKYFNYYSITQFKNCILAAGWTATLSSEYSSSPLDGSTPLVSLNNRAYEILPVLWDGTDWRVQINKTSGDELYAAYCYDEVITYPGCGDPTKNYGTTNYDFIYYGGKVLRSSAQGFVCTETNTPAAATVQLIGTSGYGSGTTDATGYYKTGSPYAHNEGTATIFLDASHTESETISNRDLMRASFKYKPPEPGAGIACDNAKGFDSFARAYVIDGDIYVKYSLNSRPYDTDPQVRITDSGLCAYPDLEFTSNGLLYLGYSNNGSVVYRYSTDWGKNWSTERSIGSGKIVRIASTSEGDIIIFHFAYDSGSSGPGKIYRSICRPGSASFTSPTAITSGGSAISVSDAGFDISITGDTRNRQILVAQVYGESTDAVFNSDDYCATFTRII